MMLPDKFRADYKAMYRCDFRNDVKSWRRVIFSGSMLMLLLGRMGGLMSKIYYLMVRRRGIEIEFSERIAGGLALAHAYCITINSSAILKGRTLLYKGATIGGVRNGLRKGVPVLGDRVVIGLNATVVGGVKIGNDVMIAPNSFVNFDVPDHSLVIGNPGVIHHKDCATDDYFPAVS